MKREELLAALEGATPKPRAVDVPALGGTVYVRALSLAEAEDLGTSPDAKRQIARGLAAVIVDEDGNRLFDPNDEEDIRRLSAPSFAKLRPLIDAANETNSASEATIEQLGNDSTTAKS